MSSKVKMRILLDFGFLLCLTLFFSWRTLLKLSFLCLCAWICWGLRVHLALHFSEDGKKMGSHRLTLSRWVWLNNWSRHIWAASISSSHHSLFTECQQGFGHWEEQGVKHASHIVSSIRELIEWGECQVNKGANTVCCAESSTDTSSANQTKWHYAFMSLGLYKGLFFSLKLSFRIFWTRPVHFLCFCLLTNF